MSNLELLLLPGMLKDALSSVLTGAGFSMSQEPGQDDPYTIVIINAEDYREPNIVGIHVSRRVKIVILANEGDDLEEGPDESRAAERASSHNLSADAFARVGSGERVLPPATAREQNLCGAIA